MAGRLNEIRERCFIFSVSTAVGVAALAQVYDRFQVWGAAPQGLLLVLRVSVNST